MHRQTCRSRSSRPAVLVAMSVMICVLGCGPKSVGRGTLSGQVRNGSQPVTGARIYFENAAQGAGCFVDLDAAGRFTVADGTGPGLPIGTYRIAVKPQVAGEQTLTGDPPAAALAGSGPKEETPLRHELIPARCLSFDTSGLTSEIREGANPPLEIDLARGP